MYPPRYFHSPRLHRRDVEVFCGQFAERQLTVLVEEVAFTTSTPSRVASSSVVVASISQAADTLLVVLVDIAAVGTPYVNHLCQFLFIFILSILA